MLCIRFKRKKVFNGAVYVGVLVAYFSMVSLSYAASSSQNYILDSATIGQIGTIEGTSTSYSTDHTSYLSFQEGESVLVTSTSSNDTGGGGGHVTIKPLDIRSHIYSETPPLTLKTNQSGTLFRKFLPIFTTLYVSPYATTPKDHSGPDTSYTLERYLVSDSDINGTPFNHKDIASNTLYRVTATQSNPSNSIYILRKFLTLIIEDPTLSLAGPTFDVFYFHPVFRVWVKMPHPVFTGNSVIFQTPYVTDYMMVRQTKDFPLIVHTSTTGTSIKDVDVQNDIHIQTSLAIQNQISEGLKSKVPQATQEPIAKPELSSVPRPPETFLSFIENILKESRVYIFLGLPFLLLFLGMIPFLFKRRDKDDSQK